MDRRDFLRTTGTLIAGATVASGMPAAGYAAESAAAAKGRTVLPINRNWRYSPKATPAARARDFDDSGFARVTVPHTNIRVPWHSFDEKSYEFVSIYRRRFRLPAAARGKRVFVDFEGVMTASTVWLNGVRLGEYKGGFTPFSFELTPHVDFDGENVLAVEVDSSEQPDIPPFGYEVDYLTFGGIYREVSLRIVSPTSLKTSSRSPKTCSPAIPRRCAVLPESASKSLEAGLSLEAALYDGDRLLAKTTQELPAGEDQGNVPLTLRLDNLGAISSGI
jgi:beta-galactosidase